MTFSELFTYYFLGSLSSYLYVSIPSVLVFSWGILQNFQNNTYLRSIKFILCLFLIVSLGFLLVIALSAYNSYKDQVIVDLKSSETQEYFQKSNFSCLLSRSFRNRFLLSDSRLLHKYPSAIFYDQKIVFLYLDSEFPKKSIKDLEMFCRETVAAKYKEEEIQSRIRAEHKFIDSVTFGDSK